MHEYSVISALLGRVEQEARARGATAIHRVRVRIGALSGVDPELLATAYETFRQDTLCAMAPLEIESVAARWVCAGCGRSLETGALLRCASCGLPATLASGDEILLDQIEMEVA